MRNIYVVAAIGIVAVLVAAGIGYATVYHGSSSSTSIDVRTQVTASIDILDTNQQPLNHTIGVPAFIQEKEISIYGYSLKLYATTVIDGNITELTSGTVRLWCLMEDSGSWMFIDDMWLTFGDGVTEYHFGIGEFDPGSGPMRVTGIPTEAIELNTDSIHNFAIHVRYSNINPALDPNGEALSQFIGSKFVFAFDGNDPLA